MGVALKKCRTEEDQCGECEKHEGARMDRSDKPSNDERRAVGKLIADAGAVVEKKRIRDASHCQRGTTELWCTVVTSVHVPEHPCRSRRVSLKDSDDTSQGSVPSRSRRARRQRLPTHETRLQHITMNLRSLDISRCLSNDSGCGRSRTSKMDRCNQGPLPIKEDGEESWSIGGFHPKYGNDQDPIPHVSLKRESDTFLIVSHNSMVNPVGILKGSTIGMSSSPASSRFGSSSCISSNTVDDEGQTSFEDGRSDSHTTLEHHVPDTMENKIFEEEAAASDCRSPLVFQKRLSVTRTDGHTIDTSRESSVAHGKENDTEEEDEEGIARVALLIEDMNMSNITPAPP
ncbi:hypothetical protein ERJ75_001039900 [Trypanosoma vivax]|uniref:Uncharacterized protein n=1 Tax=Trypanosoma vivax (strain Y486) TaxID=1055687 RepID=G0TUY5_TRYVY|nr:hypothetical protein TRVL_01265 [Trypanosoma vivax]KAH8611051.1 hypothetical protein ERJ75_001039900 [Trypanosoma vivax]CCC47772.1 hypothetical protein TVY486_0404400 [Trypanosoma vivax Y486]